MTNKFTLLPSRFSSTITAMASTKKVLIPAANGTKPMEAVITIDVLKRGGADMAVGLVKKNLGVVACHGVKIVVDALVSGGGMSGATNFRKCGALESLVKKLAAEGRLYSAVCASPAVTLGSRGLLEGLKDMEVAVEQKKDDCLIHGVPYRK